MKRQVEEL
jgi:hypothetical protein